MRNEGGGFAANLWGDTRKPKRDDRGQKSEVRCLMSDVVSLDDHT